MGKNTDVIAAVQAADEFRAVARAVSCATCEGECYTVEVKALGRVGQQEWSTWVGKREHLDVTDALDAIVRMTASVTSRLKDRAARRYLIEHQQRLW